MRQSCFPSFGTAIGEMSPIFPDICYHLSHYWSTAADISVVRDTPAHLQMPFECFRKFFPVRFGHDADVVTLYRFHEAFCCNRFFSISLAMKIFINCQTAQSYTRNIFTGHTLLLCFAG